MVNGFSFSRHGRRQRAFTLAELLIVIAIIGALISILLPSLAAARRSAARVKCLSSLRQIGNAFQMYAQDNHRYLPVVRWCPVAGSAQAETPAPNGNAVERVWIDMLSKYLLKQNTYGDASIYKQYSGSSVFFGCPAMNPDMFDPTGAPGVATGDRRYSMSYGMSVYAIGPYFNVQNQTGTREFIASGSQIAWVTPGGSFPTGYYGTQDATHSGQWYKLEQWGQHSQDKGIVADASGLDIVTSNSWTKGNETTNPPTQMYTEPALMGMDYPHPAPPSGSYISIDAMRHLAPTSDKRKILSSQGTNMLFVDGHAQGVTPRAAWIATFGGGLDETK